MSVCEPTLPVILSPEDVIVTSRPARTWREVEKYRIGSIPSLCPHLRIEFQLAGKPPWVAHPKIDTGAAVSILSVHYPESWENAVTEQANGENLWKKLGIYETAPIVYQQYLGWSCFGTPSGQGIRTPLARLTCKILTPSSSVECDLVFGLNPLPSARVPQPLPGEPLIALSDLLVEGEFAVDNTVFKPIPSFCGLRFCRHTNAGVDGVSYTGDLCSRSVVSQEAQA